MRNTKFKKKTSGKFSRKNLIKKKIVSCKEAIYVLGRLDDSVFKLTVE